MATPAPLPTLPLPLDFTTVAQVLRAAMRAADADGRCVGWTPEYRRGLEDGLLEFIERGRVVWGDAWIDAYRLTDPTGLKPPRPAIAGLTPPDVEQLPGEFADNDEDRHRYALKQGMPTV